MVKLDKTELSRFKTAKDIVVADLEKRMHEMLQFLKNTNVRHWEGPIPFHSTSQIKHGMTNKIGIYRIVHKPTNKTMYIGQGVISNRRRAHSRIFLNEGNPVVFKTENGESSSSVDSVAGRKMYLFDSDINNWEFYWIKCPKDLAKEFETQLQNYYNPEFCDKKMSGIG
jgi:hypothetical protein